MLIDFEGAVVECSDASVEALDNVAPGDQYMGKRNTGWKLLTCEKVVRTPEGAPDYVQPVEMEYSYDACECFRVIQIR